VLDVGDVDGAAARLVSRGVALPDEPLVELFHDIEWVQE
jgi:hypothetical protein